MLNQKWDASGMMLPNKRTTRRSMTLHETYEHRLKEGILLTSMLSSMLSDWKRADMWRIIEQTTALYQSALDEGEEDGRFKLECAVENTTHLIAVGLHYASEIGLTIEQLHILRLPTQLYLNLLAEGVAQDVAEAEADKILQRVVAA